MKKKKIQLQKITVDSFIPSSNTEAMKGGNTGGCTDGCTGSYWFCTFWNCTKTNCTDDCSVVCETK